MAIASPNILVVEDDRETRALIAKYLRTNACNVTTATDGREMARAMADHRVDLLILDVMLPGEDGLSLCRRVRTESQMPIIMLTARGEDVDRILGLEMGAYDSLPKPFNPRELLARINAVLRRQAAAQTVSATNGATALTFLGWRIDFRLRELRNPAGARVAMTSAEFDLLRTFCERPGRVLSRDSLLDLTQGRNTGSFERSIDVLVSRIRRKIEPGPKEPPMIKTGRSAVICSPPRWIRSHTRQTADHEAARFSESEGHQRTDRGAGGRLDHRNSPDPHRNLSYPSAGPARSAHRPRTQSARSSSPASRRGARGRTATAFRRHRAGISATGRRKPSAGLRSRGGRTGWPQPAQSASPPRQQLPDLFAPTWRRHPQGRYRAAGRRDDFRKAPAGRAATSVLDWSVDRDIAVCRHQRHVAWPVGGAGLDGAAVVVRKGRRKLQPQRRRSAASRTRP